MSLNDGQCNESEIYQNEVLAFVICKCLTALTTFCINKTSKTLPIYSIKDTCQQKYYYMYNERANASITQGRILLRPIPNE